MCVFQINLVTVLSIPILSPLAQQAYTLSHPENDRDATERAQGYTLQDASFIASILVFLFESVR